MATRRPGSARWAASHEAAHLVDRELLPRPVTWVTLGITLALLGLIYLAIAGSAAQIRTQPGGAQALEILGFPSAYTGVLSFILGLGGLLAVIYGAAVAGSEWTWGTLKNAVARGEGRIRYMVATYASVALLVGVGLLIAFVFGIIVAAVGSLIANVGIAGIDDAATIGGLPEKLVRGWLAIGEEAALGFAIATIARSQLAGIGAGIAIYFAESFATLFLPDIVKYMPFNAASAVIATSAGNNGFGNAAAARLAPDAALVVVLLWLVGALVVSGLVTERADIGG